MFDKVFLERLKTGLLLIGLVALNALLYYFGFSCKLRFQFFYLVSILCYFTPLLLVFIYVISTGRNFWIELFSNIKVASVTCVYLSIWLVFGVGYQVYRHYDRQPYEETDFELVKLSLNSNPKGRDFRNGKDPDIYLSARNYPDFLFYIPKEFVDERQTQLILQGVGNGDYVRVNISRSAYESKLLNKQSNSVMLNFCTAKLLQVYSIENGGMSILPLDIPNINKHRGYWYWDAFVVWPLVVFPSWVIFIIIRNYRVNKKRGFTR